MLPFLKKSQESSVSMPPSKVERKPDEESDFDGLHACMRELMDAFKEGDESKAAQALRSAFEICDAQPHHEGEHV